MLLTRLKIYDTNFTKNVLRFANKKHNRGHKVNNNNTSSCKKNDLQFVNDLLFCENVGIFIEIHCRNIPYK